MAPHTLQLTDEESAAVRWIVARDHERTIPDVETWLYLKARGEIRAAQTGYALARNDAILDAVEAGDKKAPLEQVLAVVDDALARPTTETREP